MALWTPSNLAVQPVEWFKGDVGVTASAGLVSAWAQQGSHTGGLTNSHDGVPGTSSLNGLTTVAFDGVFAGSNLDTPANRNFSSGGLTMFVLAKRTAGRTGGYDILINTGPPWTSTQGFALQYDVGGSPAPISAYGGNGYGGSAPFAQTASPPPAQDGYWHTIDAFFASGGVGIDFDGNAQTLSSSSAGAFPGLTGFQLDVGFNPDGNWFGGEIAEIIILNYIPTAGEKAQIQGYLAWKWGVSGAAVTDLVAKLPSGHTYKTAAPTTGAPVGTASITVAAETVAGAGKLAIKGTAAITLAGATVAGTGVSPIVGTDGGAMSTNTTAFGTGGAPTIMGSAGITEDPVTVAGSGTLSTPFPRSGDAAITIASTGLAAAGVLALKGSAAIALAPTSLAAAGQTVVRGNATIAVGAVATTGLGLHNRVGTAALLTSTSLFAFGGFGNYSTPNERGAFIPAENRIAIVPWR